MNYPTREIMVTGERVAVMTRLTVRVSRAEQRIVGLSMSGSPAARNAVRRASERLQQAMNLFDDELRAISTELESAGRSPRRSGEQKPKGESKPVLSRKKNAEAPVPGAEQPAQPQAAQQGQQKQAQPQGQKQQSVQRQPQQQKANTQQAKAEKAPAAAPAVAQALQAL